MHIFFIHEMNIGMVLINLYQWQLYQVQNCTIICCHLSEQTHSLIPVTADVQLMRYRSK